MFALVILFAEFFQRFRLSSFGFNLFVLFLFQPQNLVLTGEFPDCDVKLCDFGISRYISHGADIREILGTPDYVGECFHLGYTLSLFPSFAVRRTSR